MTVAARIMFFGCLSLSIDVGPSQFCEVDVSGTSQDGISSHLEQTSTLVIKDQCDLTNKFLSIAQELIC